MTDTETTFANGEVRQYPPWREAIERFLKAEYKADDVIPFMWFYDAFGIQEPSPEMTKGEADKLELSFLRQFSEMQKRLLAEHQIDLTNERGYGYRVVPPEKQTKVAYEDGIADARKSLRKMRDRIINVNHALLTAEQRRENADALARLSMVSEVVGKHRRLKAPE